MYKSGFLSRQGIVHVLAKHPQPHSVLLFYLHIQVIDSQLAVEVLCNITAYKEKEESHLGHIPVSFTLQELHKKKTKQTSPSLIDVAANFFKTSIGWLL